MKGFSIIVPTHGRARMVESLLLSLRQARCHFTGESEVLVVDSSAAEDANIIREACSRWQAQYHRADNNVAYKRNMGVQKARGEAIFFIDSDCEADTEVLNEHWSIYEMGNSCVGGVLGVTEWKGPKGAVWQVLDLSPSFSAAFSFALWLDKAPWGTCTNLSVRRDALLEIGGFDETLPLRVYGEDVDLGLRLTKAGYSLQCNPRARVLHSRETMKSLTAALHKMFSTGRADIHLGIRHQERLVLEFPLPLLCVALLLLVTIARLLMGYSLWSLLVPPAWLCLLVFLQSLLSALTSKDKLSNIPRWAAVTLLELSFEAGRLKEALVHGGLSRMWTKFVYLKEQLVAERQRRAVQMWAMVLSFLLLLAFSL